MVCLLKSTDRNRKPKLKTAEGIETTVPVLYKLQDWCENFVDYLRSMMSYSDSFDLLEFRKTKYRIVSPLEYLSFSNKNKNSYV